MLSIRDLPNCNLTRSCQIKCSSTTCNSVQACNDSNCILTKLNTELVNATTTTTTTKNRTALIAGLVTGLVGFTLLLVAILGIVYYKRRKLKKQADDEKLSPHPPIIISDINAVLPPPPPPPTATLPPISEANQWQTTEYLDYDHPHSPFIIGAQSLQIPHLDSPDPSSPTLIRRSLNIQPTTTMDYTQLNRSSSVKVTKYDHRLIPAQPITKTDQFNDDELRRAVSVKKNNSTNSHSSSITRVGSVHSEDVKLAKPTMVRINTITSKEGGITRKRSFRTVIEQPPFYVSLNDPSTSPPPTPPPPSTIPEDDNRINLYFCPEQSQISIRSSQSTSTLGDGEITVYWQPDASP